MPTYEYACQSCGHHVEVYQRFSDEPLTECGVCGGQLRKVFHPAGILFKGSGFYATDSRAARSKSSSSSDDGGSSSTSESKSKSADTKASASTSKDAASSAAKKSPPSSSEKSA